MPFHFSTSTIPAEKVWWVNGMNMAEGCSQSMVHYTNWIKRWKVGNVKTACHFILGTVHKKTFLQQTLTCRNCRFGRHLSSDRNFVCFDDPFSSWTQQTNQYVLCMADSRKIFLLTSFRHASLISNNNNNNHDNVYGAIIMTKVTARVHPRLSENWQLPSTSTIVIVIIT